MRGEKKNDALLFLDHEGARIRECGQRHQHVPVLRTLGAAAAASNARGKADKKKEERRKKTLEIIWRRYEKKMMQRRQAQGEAEPCWQEKRVQRREERREERGKEDRQT